MKQNYVLVYAKPLSCKFKDQVLLIEKKRPEFQKGRLNLLGGKIESGEGIIEAALRELKEESGISGTNPEYMGLLHGEWGSVHCIKVIAPTTDINPRQEEDEKTFWMDWLKVNQHPKLMPNLRIIIPLIRCEVKDWSIHTNDDHTLVENIETNTVAVTTRFNILES